MLVRDCYSLIILGLWIRTLSNVRESFSKSWAIGLIDHLQSSLIENDLAVSVSWTTGSRYSNVVAKIKSLPDDTSPLGQELSAQFSEVIQSLENVVFAESSTKKIYILPERRFNTDYLLNNPAKLIKDGIFIKLDEIARYDITAACKSLLFGQATAAAFHILRATESVLKSYYFHHRKKNRLKKPMWSDMVAQLQAKKTGKPPLSLLKALDNIRQTYRNPTQHPEAIYDLDRVQDLFGVCFDVIGQMGAEL